MRVRQGSCRLAVDIEGEVEFDESETSIVRVSRGGRFRIAEERGGVERELLAEPGANGPSLEYEVDGEPRPFDAEGRRWLAQLLPELFRSTGLDHEGRVGRILQRGGLPALLAELRLISSDYVQRLYVSELFEQARPSEAQVRQVIELATASIDSDYDMRQVLTTALANHPAEAVVGPRFAETCAAIDSDYDLREVLTEVIAKARTHAPGEQALRCVDDIDSDYDARMVLTAAAERWPKGRELPQSFFTAAGAMNSDYDRRTTLEAVTARRPVSATDLANVLATADRFHSSYDRATLLVSVAESAPLSGELAAAYRAAARGIGSEYDRQRALAALADGGE